jgi:hypothetical protein
MAKQSEVEKTFKAVSKLLKEGPLVENLSLQETFPKTINDLHMKAKFLDLICEDEECRKKFFDKISDECVAQIKAYRDERFEIWKSGKDSFEVQIVKSLVDLVDFKEKADEFVNMIDDVSSNEEEDMYVKYAAKSREDLIKQIEAKNKVLREVVRKFRDTIPLI